MTVDTKTFRRMPAQGKIFGVCAGIANYFEMDVTLVRAIFVVLTLLSGGAFLLIYLVSALIMPVTEHVVVSATKADDSQVRTGNVRNYVGIGLIIFGAWLLLGQFFPFVFWSLRWDFIWPVVLIIIGFMILIRKR